MVKVELCTLASVSAVFKEGESLAPISSLSKTYSALTPIIERHQKVIEEAPSPFVHSRPGMRAKMTSCAVALAKSVKYGSAGTVEFLVDDTDGSFYFLEVNTRLQVEHGITEMCYDVDLVSLMLRQAAEPIEEETLMGMQKDGPRGFAIEARVYAEIPSRNFAPSPGLLQHIEWVKDARVDTWVTSGTNISPYYDPMIAKVLVWAESHDEVTDKMIRALTESKVQGCPTNIQYLADIVRDERFRKGDTTTAFLNDFAWKPSTLDIVSAGAYTTIQDLPARRGVTNGVPESGPMDPVSFRVANLLAGNPETTEALEVTLIGPELLFNVSATVAVTGGVVKVTIDGRDVDMYMRLHVPAGSKLKIGTVSSGCRAYIAVQGGFPNVPVYLGSKSTTSTLGLGGYQGRQLQPSDALDIIESKDDTQVSLPAGARLDSFWEDSVIHVMSGPHDDPEYITDDDRELLYGSVWKISHNATRSGYQVKGPRLTWAREDGGEGGGHPSNVIDEPYFIGAMNWNGDNPVILPNDAPMAGGLAMTHTVIRADMWRLGQRRPGAEIQFKRVTWQSAKELRLRTERYVADVKAFVQADGKGDVTPPDVSLPDDYTSAILHEIPEPIRVVYRQAGEASISVSYGPMTASALTRAHIQQVLLRIRGGKEVKGVIASTGTTRAYSVEFDPLETTQDEMLQQLLAVERSVVNAHDLIPSRLFRFPILFDDPVSKQAVRDYMATVRDSAIYLPDNQEYIAKANGVDVEQASKSIVSCPQLVTEVSFVVGCPLLLPLDPRSVFVAQKYNPVRSFTPEGTVGLGGPLYVIYPSDSPGGYQLCGRTVSTWDTYATKPGFKLPWLMREFDQIQFYEVDADEYAKAFEESKTGRFHFQVEDTTFDPAKYSQFLDSIAEETQAYRARREASTKAAGEEEKRLLAAWRERQGTKEETVEDTASGAITVASPMTSSVWKVLVEVGDVVKSGQTLAIMEAMKMEIRESENCRKI